MILLLGALSAALAMGYGVLFTVVGDYRAAYGISDTQVGIIIGLGFLSAFVAQILLAPIADRGRARMLVVVGVLVNVAGLLAMGFGEDFATITAGRLVSGIGIGAATPAIRRIVVLADPVNLGRNLGWLLSADVLGFALGPAVSAMLVGPLGLAAPFAVVAVASTVLVVFALRIDVHETTDFTAKRLAFDLLRVRPVAGAVVLGAAAFLMIGAFDALWDVVHEDLETPLWMANLGITLFAIPLIVLGPIGGRYAQRVGPFPLAAWGLVAAAVFMTVYGLVPNGTWIFGVSIAHSLTDGFTIAASGVAISMAVPEDRQAGAQGVLGAAQALAGGIAAIAIGATYDQFGRATAYGAAAVAMTALMVIGMALAAPAWSRQSRQGSSPEAASTPVG